MGDRPPAPAEIAAVEAALRAITKLPEEDDLDSRAYLAGAAAALRWVTTGQPVGSSRSGVA